MSIQIFDAVTTFKTAFYEIVNNFFKKIATYFGYPEIPGMQTELPLSDEALFIARLPVHQSSWPPKEIPKNWWEVFLGTTPKLMVVPRYFYQSDEEGFYNFYIENYKNIFFLPDWLSQFLQVNCNYCLDITGLETIRDAIFLLVIIYYQIVVLRITLAWLIFINPYTIPWCFLSAAVDWTEDVMQGLTPSLYGVNLTGTLLLGIVGAIADSLNHIVFTMPYLPSEGERMRVVVDNKGKDILVFHYLPILWYRYPIPNKIREFWYKERPDILSYMQKYYNNLDIQFLPDNIIIEKVEEIKKMIHRLDNTYLSHDDSNFISAISISSQIISKTTENQLINLNILSEFWENLTFPFL